MTFAAAIRDLHPLPGSAVPPADLKETARQLDAVYQGLPIEALLDDAVHKLFPGKIALLSSFGTEAAVVLHYLAQVDKSVPVLFLETGKHFMETLMYRDILIDRFGFTDAREIKPDAATVAANGEATVLYLSKLDTTNGNVGAIGFCWGGGAVNTLATKSPELKAGVAYYGAQPPASEVTNIKAALLLHYAGLDDRINAGIDAYKKALEENGKKFEIYVYDGVNHAFNNDTSQARYDKAASDLAWSRTVEFLKAKLS